MAVFETVGDLADDFGKQAFTKHLQDLFCSYLTNSAAAVREMGVDKCAGLAKSFGSPWITNVFVPKVIKLYQTDNLSYNCRITAIKSLSEMIRFMNRKDVSS